MRGTDGAFEPPGRMIAGELFEDSDDLMLAADEAGMVVDANPALLRVLGAVREDLCGKRMEELRFLPDSGEFGDARRLRLEGSLTTGEGISLWVVWTLQRMRVKGRTFCFIVGVDMTQSKAEEEQLRRVVEAAPNGLLMVDGAGTIVLVNAEVLRLLGYHREELIGKPVEILVPNRYRAIHPHHRAEYNKDPQARVMGHGRDLYAVRKDGTEIPVEIGLNPIHTRAGTLVLGAIVDLTQRKETERILRENEQRYRALAAEAERANLIKDQFLATLSHELRTPLNAIIGWSQLIRRPGVGKEQQQQGMEVIERNARTQAKIINDLLEMNRIVSGKMRLELKEISIGDLIDAAIKTMHPAATAKHIEIRRRPDDFFVNADPTRLQQCIWNILSNAVKFTPPGGHIDIWAFNEEGHVNITFRDSGIGIAPEFLPFVFDRFRQADSSSTRRQGGLGLGLAIAKSIVELHGGTISVRSEGSDKGASFTIALPARPVSRTGLAQDAERKDESLVSKLAGIRVLVVDDEEDGRGLLKEVLESSGASVTTAASADEALALLGQIHPQIVLSDIAMPAKDGIEFVRELRSLPAAMGGRTPAVAVTAYAGTDDKLRALRAGYQVHLAKPIEPDELLAIVAGMSSRDEMRLQ